MLSSVGVNNRFVSDMIPKVMNEKARHLLQIKVVFFLEDKPSHLKQKGNNWILVG